MAEAIYKYNNGEGALLCSGCRVIIREGKDFTEKDTELMMGILKGDKVEAQYCEDCKNNT